MNDNHYCELNHTCAVCETKCCNNCCTGYIKNSKRYWICDKHEEYFFYKDQDKDELFTNDST